MDERTFIEDLVKLYTLTGRFSRWWEGVCLYVEKNMLRECLGGKDLNISWCQNVCRGNQLHFIKDRIIWGFLDNLVNRK
jgi:hypothetical protein